MKRIIFYFFFLELFFLKVCISQNNYIEYHRTINTIESLLIQKKYNEANIQYKNTFKKYTNPFSKDLYNAAVCATLINNNADAIYFLKELAKKGVLKRSIKQKIFRKIKKCKEWKEFYIEYDKTRINYKENFNDSISKEVDLWYERDQYFRRKRNAYTRYADTINAIDSINVLKLIKIINKFGYPGESLIGTDVPNSLSNNPYIVLRHAYQNKNYLLSDLLLESLKNGTFHPYVYAELEDKRSNWDGVGDKYGTLAIVFIKGKKREIFRTTQQINDFNENRSKIGLESYEEYKAKIELLLNKSPFIFACYEGKAMFSGMSLKQFDLMNKKNNE